MATAHSFETPVETGPIGFSLTNTTGYRSYLVGAGAVERVVFTNQEHHHD